MNGSVGRSEGRWATAGWVLAAVALAVAAPRAQEPATAEKAADCEVAAGQTVEGNVVTVDQTVRVRGKVRGSVHATRGAVYLYRGAEVAGDVVVSAGELHREDGVRVGGSVLVIPGGQAPSPSVPPPAPEPPGPPATVHHGDLVRYGGPAQVGASEVIEGDVIAFGGPISVAGQVRGDVAGFGGPVEVSGHVDGDVIATGGPLNLLDGARVDGDATAIGGPLNRGANVTVGGSTDSFGGPVTQIPWALLGAVPGPATGGSASDGADRALTYLGRAFGWLFSSVALLLLTGLIALAFPRAARTVADRIEEEPLRVAFHGLVGWLLLLPILFVLVLLCLTWILIPFVLAALAGLVLIGYVGVGLYSGRWLAHRLNRRIASAALLAVVGVAALRMAGLVAILPYGGALAALLTSAVLVMGLGAALMTRFGTDPTGTWLARRFSGGNGGARSRSGEAESGQVPRAPTPHNDHGLDRETLEALRDLPEDNEP